MLLLKYLGLALLFTPVMAWNSIREHRKTIRAANIDEFIWAVDRHGCRTVSVLSLQCRAARLTSIDARRFYIDLSAKTSCGDTIRLRIPGAFEDRDFATQFTSSTYVNEIYQAAVDTLARADEMAGVIRHRAPNVEVRLESPGGYLAMVSAGQTGKGLAERHFDSPQYV
jgi:hypothetical protein